MSNTYINSRIAFKTGLTEEWDNSNKVFIPENGELCIYLDKMPYLNEQKQEKLNHEGKKITVAGIKIGDTTSLGIHRLPFLFKDYISNEQIDRIFNKGSSINSTLSNFSLGGSSLGGIH